MAWFDVTRPLSPDTTVFPGDPHIHFRQIPADDFLVTEVLFGTHSGTHIDAPRHVLKKGQSIDAVPLENLIGECRVLDCAGHTGPIESESLAQGFPGPSRVLLKTRCESGLQSPEAAYLGQSSAYFLADHRVRCVGIDVPSIEDPTGTGEIHRILLQAGIPIIELLDLSGVAPGDYWMAALPLRLEGLDGSPARVVLSDTFPED
ncbi:MAG: cyclase family protein [Methanomicrobiales archaeon]|nr:cyclase family protein [Methanomicrobiales archaeon]